MKAKSEAVEVGDAKTVAPNKQDVPKIVMSPSYANSITHSASSLSLNFKALAYIGAFVIVVILIFLLRHGASLASTSYTNKENDTYSVAFYNGSSTKTYSFGATTPENSLVSPVETKGGVPIAMSVVGFPNNFASASDSDLSLLTTYKNCSQGSNIKKVASVDVSSLSLTADVCSSGNGYFTSIFGSGKTVYSMQIGPYDSAFNTASASVSAKDKKSAPSVSAVKSIIGSFKFVSTKQS